MPKPRRYAELHCKTNFSFLQGASHAEELVIRAVELEYDALAVTDVNTLAGIVRAHVAAKAKGLKLLIGAEVVLADAPPILLYAADRAAYGRLSRLITVGRRAAVKGSCHLTFTDLVQHADGLLAAVIPSEEHARLADYRALFGDRCYLAASLHCGSSDEPELERFANLARKLRLPLLATGDVHYHDAGRRPLQDVLTAIRHGKTVARLGALRFPNADRHLQAPVEMARRFARYPAALAHTLELAGRCSFTLDELRYQYPEELCPPGFTVAQHLARLTWEGAHGRYPAGIPAKVEELVNRELVLIEELRYESFFLTVWDLVQFARSRGILCQGRGSAANSAVCYCLGITSVDPDRTDVLFERFVSRERDEAPDIDVDFEHERREEVLQYIYAKYGRDRAGIAAEVICYRPRSAVRDVGKALGLSLDRVDRLAKALDHIHEGAAMTERLAEAGLDAQSPKVVQLLRLAGEILGFPRHLSQHVGGFVITQGPLSELVPIENAAMPGRTFIEWDKDDLDALGILKVDCLALGMLTCIRKSFELIAEHHGRALTLADVPAEDQVVYDMICKADTVGVFQIESRAQMSMLPRLKPRCFYDLVIEVAIVRPGPIQGNMVHPYLRRRDGLETATYPSPEVEQVLSKTLGVPLFQEQVMRLAMVAAGFSAGEADQLRRAMGTWRGTGVIEKYRVKMCEGMRARGLPEAFTAQIFEQIRGFGEYGFPESHAASFALLAYVSAWLKCHYPVAFAAALLNSLPMGFYAPAQIVSDLQAHEGVVLPVDVNRSDWDCVLEPRLRVGTNSVGAWCPDEKYLHKSDPGGVSAISLGLSAAIPPESFNRHLDPGGVAARPDCDPSGVDSSSFIATGGIAALNHRLIASTPPGPNGVMKQPLRPALRLGYRLLKGFPQAAAFALCRARDAEPFRSVRDVARRTGLGRPLLARLAAADAFGSLGLRRRDALWQVLALSDELPLFAELDDEEVLPSLPPLALEGEVAADYESVGLSLKAHPMSFLRAPLQKAGVVQAAALMSTAAPAAVRVAGLVLMRQQPPTAKGTIFITLEDETGSMNLIVWKRVWERYRTVARGAVALLVEGEVQRTAGVVHVCATRFEDLSHFLRRLASQSRDFR